MLSCVGMVCLAALFVCIMVCDKVVFCHLYYSMLDSSCLGCSINGIYLGCIVHADDKLLMSTSVQTLQSMLDIFY
jgi:hypothetical protein